MNRRNFLELLAATAALPLLTGASNQPSSWETFRRRCQEIAQNPEPPSYSNTIQALDRLAQTLQAVCPGFRLERADLPQPYRKLAQETLREPGLRRRIESLFQSSYRNGLGRHRQRRLYLYFKACNSASSGSPKAEAQAR